MQCIVGVVYMWSHWNILRNSGLSEAQSCFAKMLLPRGPQLFTAMLDADTDDLDRNDWDHRAGNISSWLKNSVDQWAIHRIMIIYTIDCQCHCADTWMNLADGTRHWFLHCTLMQLYWMICRWIHVISNNYWGCIGVYCLMTTKTTLNSNEYSKLSQYSACRRCQPVSITYHVQCLSWRINLFYYME